MGTIVHRLRHVERIRQTFEYEATQYAYAHKILGELHKTLAAELRLGTALMQGGDAQRLIGALRAQVKVEQNLVDKIQHLASSEFMEKSFEDIFLELYSGMKILRVLDTNERMMLRRVEHVLPADIMARREKEKSKPESIKRRFEHNWVEAVYYAMQSTIEEALYNQELVDHPDLEFQFVGSPAFETLGEHIYYELRPGPPSNESRAQIRALVQYFRHMFTSVE